MYGSCYLLNVCVTAPAGEVATPELAPGGEDGAPALPAATDGAAAGTTDTKKKKKKKVRGCTHTHTHTHTHID